ncbi:MAG: gamma-glutamyltransferase, partial [Acidobacteria bacterium]|nr:gamma-glutamyltransferase [Acidobacteriota bacterium]
MRRRLLTSLLLGATISLAVLARQPVRAPKAMVVSREPHATEAGIRVLRAGGNAVDAAVAVGFALAVTHPSAGNLGGGGFMLIRFADGRTAFLDFRERAPEKASRDMYLGPDGEPTRDSLEGWRAPGVPGTVRGLELAARKYGRKKWPELLAPSIELAEKGFPVSYGLARSLRATKKLERFPESKRIFLKDGAYWEPGERLAQPELAATLKRIAGSGARDFYEGETARRLVAAMRANGGLWTAADLAGYAVVERKPLTGRYRSYEIIGAPPPSSGGVGILGMLGMLEGTGYEKPGAGAAASIHYVAEVMRRYYADRAEYLADPDFARVPVAGLLDPAYLARRRQSIDPERATPSARVSAGRPPGEEGVKETADRRNRLSHEESSETTHYSVVDAEGNAVAVTYTLNGGYGCGVTPPGVGFLLNNEMDDFAVKPGAPNYYGLIQGERNAIAPRKRPLSSMTPTIVLRDGNLYLVAGSPGGPRIISTVLQVLLNVLDFGMNIQEAADWPRFHHQWLPDKLLME